MMRYISIKLLLLEMNSFCNKSFSRLCCVTRRFVILIYLSEYVQHVESFKQLLLFIDNSEGNKTFLSWLFLAI